MAVPCRWDGNQARNRRLEPERAGRTTMSTRQDPESFVGIYVLLGARPCQDPNARSDNSHDDHLLLQIRDSSCYPRLDGTATVEFCVQLEGHSRYPLLEWLSI